MRSLPLQACETAHPDHQKQESAGFPDIEDGADLGMVESRGCTGLAVETFPRQLIPESIGQDFDRDIPPESRVAGLVHLTHATGTYRHHDLVTVRVCRQMIRALEI